MTRRNRHEAKREERETATSQDSKAKRRLDEADDRFEAPGFGRCMVNGDLESTVFGAGAPEKRGLP
jgi:hypothetical protein